MSKSPNFYAEMCDFMPHAIASDMPYAIANGAMKMCMSGTVHALITTLKT